MKRIECWAIKVKGGKFINREWINNFWEADKVLTFRTRKDAKKWLEENPFWRGKGEVVKVTVTVKEIGE